ncbi:unnamed protein product [Arctogadus glacialis]
MEVEVHPSADGVSYAWDFADGSPPHLCSLGRISHVFGALGLYNVSVRADNGVSALMSWLSVEVAEEVAGLTLSSNGPNELSSATEIRGEVDSGSGVVLEFDFGDASPLRDLPLGGVVSHTYRALGNYTVIVTASNSLGSVRQSINVEVYKLGISEILPRECVSTRKEVQFTALVTVNVSTCTFHWDFGEALPSALVKGKPTATHTYSNPGVFLVNVTVYSPLSSMYLSANLCVEDSISSVALQTSKSVVAVGERVCLSVLVLPEQIGYRFLWQSSQSPSSEAANADRCFVFNKEGNEDVSVIASNKVSRKSAEISIVIQRPVGKPSVAHSGLNGALTVNTTASFWVHSCTGTNYSVLWDFGDGSPVGSSENVSHIFTSTGQFMIIATVFNAISKTSATQEVIVVLPVIDLVLRSDPPCVAVREETVITAVSTAIGSDGYVWSINGVTVNAQGSPQLRYTFPTPGVYQVSVTAQNPVRKRHAAILIEAHERIERLCIVCPNLTLVKYTPTGESLHCTASLASGSNVSYSWYSVHRGTNQSAGLGDSFRLPLEAPGDVFVHLTASNKLGETTSNVSLVAVERVAGAELTTPSDVVAAGRPVNISVDVASGSDLRYSWYVNADLSPLRTHIPFLLHMYGRLGQHQVEVRVENILGHVSATKELTVQEEIRDVDFQINQKPRPFYIAAGAVVWLCGGLRTGSDLTWEWAVGAALVRGSSPSLNHSFTHEGLYKVSLNVSNGVNWQAVSHSVTVQEPISGLTLDLNRSNVCTQDPVVFTPLVSTGTDVSYNMTFAETDLDYGLVFLKDRFVLTDLPVGLHVVTVEAWNLVSSSNVTSSVYVDERVSGLHMVGCCSVTLSARTDTRFRAQIQSTSPAVYTWTFSLEGSEPVQVSGQEVTFSPPGSGTLSVLVEARSGVCSQSLNDTFLVEFPVQEVHLLCQSDGTFTGHIVKILASVIGGSHLKFHWDFGDSTEVLVTDKNMASHTYHTPGVFHATVNVSNNVSQVWTQIRLEVRDLQCGGPQAELVQSRPTILRSSPIYFEAVVDVKNCSAYKAAYLWEILRRSEGDPSGPAVNLGSKVSVTSPLLSIPGWTLEVGRYDLVFTVSLHGTPLRIQRGTLLTVAPRSLEAVIKGGSVRLWPPLSDLVLDGSASRDPDADPDAEDQLEYHWDFNEESSTACEPPCPHIDRERRQMTVPGNQLHSSRVYVFTLTVQTAGKRAVSTTQTVRVCEAGKVFPVTVDCVSCSSSASSSSSPSRRVSYTDPLVLSGLCERCDAQAQYQWSAKDQSGSTFDLDEVTTSTGGRSPALVLRPGVLQEGRSYTFTLTSTQPEAGLRGSGGLTVAPHPPPSGGRCVLLPGTDVIHPLETLVSYSCTGWKHGSSEGSQLIYTFQVAPCGSSITACPLLTLYRGTRSSLGTVVPAGVPEPERNGTALPITVLVEDQFGATAIALHRTLTVEHQRTGTEASDWLRKQSQRELWVLLQHGNPQESLAYSLALTSHLHQVESGRSDAAPWDTREIRAGVTRLLVSLPVSTLYDVGQVSSALIQSTLVMLPRCVLPRCLHMMSVPSLGPCSTSRLWKEGSSISVLILMDFL